MAASVAMTSVMDLVGCSTPRTEVRCTQEPTEVGVPSRSAVMIKAMAVHRSTNMVDPRRAGKWMRIQPCRFTALCLDNIGGGVINSAMAL